MHFVIEEQFLKLGLLWYMLLCEGMVQVFLDELSDVQRVMSRSSREHLVGSLITAVTVHRQSYSGRLMGLYTILYGMESHQPVLSAY